MTSQRCESRCWAAVIILTPCALQHMNWVVLGHVFHVGMFSSVSRSNFFQWELGLSTVSHHAFLNTAETEPWAKQRNTPWPACAPDYSFTLKITELMNYKVSVFFSYEVSVQEIYCDHFLHKHFFFFFSKIILRFFKVKVNLQKSPQPIAFISSSSSCSSSFSISSSYTFLKLSQISSLTC